MMMMMKRLMLVIHFHVTDFSTITRVSPLWALLDDSLASGFFAFMEGFPSGVSDLPATESSIPHSLSYGWFCSVTTCPLIAT